MEIEQLSHIPSRARMVHSSEFDGFSTKATMDCLALPSFHEGNGSAAPAMVVVKATEAMRAGRRF